MAKIITTPIKDLIIIEPVVYADDRGYFLESFNEKEYQILLPDVKFVQDNEAMSGYGVLRGLHFQTGEFAQAKLVRVVKGSVLDVAVDLRIDSPTYGKHFSVELNERNKRLFFLPRGFAHGYVVLSNETIFQYKCDNYYAPHSESGIIFNDPELNIDWIIEPNELIISDKDKKNKYFKDINSFEKY